VVPRKFQILLVARFWAGCSEECHGPQGFCRSIMELHKNCSAPKTFLRLAPNHPERSKQRLGFMAGYMDSKREAVCDGDRLKERDDSSSGNRMEQNAQGNLPRAFCFFH